MALRGHEIVTAGSLLLSKLLGSIAVRIKCMVEAAEVQNLHETCIRKAIKGHNLNLKMGNLWISVTGIPDDRFRWI